MRLFAPVALQAFWRDRGPTPVAEFATRTPAQSISTVIVSYTVPVDRVAVIETYNIDTTITRVMQRGETFLTEVSVLNTVPAFIYRRFSGLHNGEGPGSVGLKSNGSIQLPAGFAISLRVISSMVTGGITVDGTMWGVEYDV